MTFNLLIPDINNKPKTTKDAVINILIYEWPLSMRQIYRRIKKKYGYSSSYQSVYKSVKELKMCDVLHENQKKYEINIAWVKNLQSFTDIVETNYYATEKLENVSGLKDSKSSKDLIILTFETLFDAEKYLYYFMKAELLKKNNQDICFQMTSEWRPAFYLRAEYNYYRKLQKQGHKFYFLCTGNTNLEKKYKDFYRSLGTKYNLVQGEYHNEAISFSNYFIQIFIPESQKKKIKKHLKEENEISLLKALEEKSSIKLIINKDKELASSFKKQVLKKF